MASHIDGIETDHRCVDEYLDDELTRSKQRLKTLTRFAHSTMKTSG